MKINISIFSYQRKQMLESLIEEIEFFKTSNPDHTVKYTIYDDGSDFFLDNDNFNQFNHKGKSFFWQLYNYAFNHLKTDDSDLYMFIPSDFKDIDFERIIKTHLEYGKTDYVYNLQRDDRMSCWNNKVAKLIDKDTYQCWFTDCGFMTNKSTLQLLKYEIKEINPLRFKADKNISSGVGHQLTQRLNEMNIPMYLPVKSMVFHGDHASVMHPEMRKKHPLISK